MNSPDTPMSLESPDIHFYTRAARSGQTRRAEPAVTDLDRLAMNSPSGSAVPNSHDGDHHRTRTGKPLATVTRLLTGRRATCHGDPGPTCDGASAGGLRLTITNTFVIVFMKSEWVVKDRSRAGCPGLETLP
jgi:hypothetical protein